MRNISVEELCGFRDALLEMRIPVDLSEFAPIDIVGTGGDGKNTFNISTASCFTVRPEPVSRLSKRWLINGANISSAVPVM